MIEDQQQILQKIRGSVDERHSAIRALANNITLKKDVINYIIHHKGTDDDGLMIFHDSILAFVKKVFADPLFILDGKLEAYIFGIAKLKWVDKIRTNVRNPVYRAYEVDQIIGTAIQPESKFDHSDKAKILEKIMGHLGQNCKDVLMYWAGGYDMKEIANLTGYKSEGVARKKKCNCFKALMEWLEAHPEDLNELKKIM